MGAVVVRVLAVIAEILTVGIVGARRHLAEGVDQPVAVAVVGEQAVQLRLLVHVLAHQALQALQLLRLHAVHLQALDQIKQHGIGLLQGIAGLARQSGGQIGGFDLGIAQLHLAGAPHQPTIGGHQRHADQYHEDPGQRHQGRPPPPAVLRAIRNCVLTHRILLLQPLCFRYRKARIGSINTP